MSRVSVADPSERDTDTVLLYRQPARRSSGVVVFYLVLVGLLLFAYSRGGSGSVSSFLLLLLVGVLLVYLARYASTAYSMDDRSLRARRLFGSRRLRLDRIRRVQPANLRDLGAVGFLGTWGWRGRVWSPIAGTYDTVHTTSQGLLVSGEGVPVFISPVDPESFLKELSRRVRSVNGGIAPDLAPV